MSAANFRVSSGNVVSVACAAKSGGVNFQGANGPVSTRMEFRVA